MGTGTTAKTGLIDAVEAGGGGPPSGADGIHTCVVGHGVRDRVWGAAKRTFDVVVAAVLLLVLSPLFAVVALLIRLDSPGPVFFAALRIGHRWRPLRMLKFRKMCEGASGLPLTLSDDRRYTGIGAWLARHKLDELPQLWHVLRGEMSLIGPRPESPVFVTLFEQEYDRILDVRPGLFGLSQLAFAREGEVLDRDEPVAHYIRLILPQKVKLDRLYVDRHGPTLDMRILFWSVVTLVLGQAVAVDRDSGKLSLRRR